MVKFTFEEGVQADTLLLAARELLVEAEKLAAGEVVRVTFFSDGVPVLSATLPYRVVRYARWAIGTPAVVSEGVKLLFYSRGVAVCVLPTAAGYASFIRAFGAHLDAQHRKGMRKMRQIRQQLFKNQAVIDATRQQKGGQAA